MITTSDLVAMARIASTDADWLGAPASFAAQLRGRIASIAGQAAADEFGALLGLPQLNVSSPAEQQCEFGRVAEKRGPVPFIPLDEAA